jgi:uncharacterized membrane protein
MKNQLRKWIQQDIVMGITTVVVIGLMLQLALAKHWGLKSQMNDLGNVVQIIYNTSQGRFMEMTNVYMLNVDKISRWGVHANIIYLFFVPIFWLGGGAEWLIGIQVLIVISGAIPLYLMGKKWFGKQHWWALVGPIMYWSNPMIQDGILYDVHAIVMAAPVILWTWWWGEQGKWKWSLAGAISLMLFKEDLSLTTIMMGLIWMADGWRKKEKTRQQIGLAMTISGIVYFGLITGWLMPHLKQGAEGGLIEERYGYLGNSVTEIATKAITQPRLVSTEILKPEKMKYLSWIVLAGGMVGLIAPQAVLLAVPSLMLSMLSRNPIMYQPWGWYYATPAAAIMILASWRWLSWVKAQKILLGWKWQQWILGTLGLVGIISLLYSPLPYGVHANWSDYQVSEHAKLIKQIKPLIPDGASLTVQNNLGAQLAERANIVIFPYRIGKSEYVLVDVTDPYNQVQIWPRQWNWVGLNSLSIDNYQTQIQQLLDNQEYGLIYAHDGYLLWQKGVENQIKARWVGERLEILKQKYQNYGVEYGSVGGDGLATGNQPVQ